jgi:glycolate oxidase
MRRRPPFQAARPVRRWLADELGPEQHTLQQRIKAAFDPRHILNPGKAL